MNNTTMAAEQESKAAAFFKFTAEERRLKKLEGLLPPNQETLQLQSERVLEQLEAKNLVPLNQFNILKEILSTNQTLFYKVLIDNIQKLAPIVYTPTVGEACIRFDHIYREPSGIYLSAFHNAPKLESPKLQRREAGAGKAFSSYLTCRELLQAQFALIYFN
jgi:hypothetical protein